MSKGTKLTIHGSIDGELTGYHMKLSLPKNLNPTFTNAKGRWLPAFRWESDDKGETWWIEVDKILVAPEETYIYMHENQTRMEKIIAHSKLGWRYYCHRISINIHNKILFSVLG